MEIFYGVFGSVAALCAGVIILTLFFLAVGHFKRTARGFDIVKSKGIVKDGKLVNVYLSGGKSALGVRFIGFTDQRAAGDGIPYQFSSMVIFEAVKGSRILIRADSIKMIEEIDGTEGKEGVN